MLTTVDRENIFNPLLLFPVLCLLGLGVVMVTSASLATAEGMGLPAWFFALRHLLYLGIGITLCFVVTKIPLSFWKMLRGPLLLGSIVLLFIVLLPGVSREINGSTRWLHLGFISLQISEFTKLTLIIFMAGYLAQREQEVQTELSGFLKPLFILVLISGLLLLEPDFGATVVIVATALGMLFLGGVPFRNFFILVVLVLGVLAMVAVTSPYRIQRLTSFLDPWHYQFNSGYQLTQSLIAFGRGGWFGTGLGNSIQKLLYLPEPHTDFLYAVLAEELGLFGALFVLLLFTAWIWRVLRLGKEAFFTGNRFEGFMAYGIALWIGLQAMINIGVNVGVLPTKGLTLPFMSYGGNSLIVGLLAVGILFRIDFELLNPPARFAKLT